MAAIYDFNNRLSPNWMQGTAFDPNLRSAQAQFVRPYGGGGPGQRADGQYGQQREPRGTFATIDRARQNQTGIFAPGQPGYTQPTGTTGNQTTGITNGTIGMQTINDAMRNFGFQQAPGVPVSPGGAGQINQQYGDLMNQGLQTSAIDFARNAAFQQAQMDLAQQRARSDSSVGFGNLLARLYEMQLNGQNAQQNLLMGLVG